MTLKSLYGKYVTIVADNGRIFYGVVDDYIFPEDNENGVESIVLKTDNSGLVEFTREDIEKIYIK